MTVAATLLAAVTASLHVVLRGVRQATTELNGETDVLRHADQALRFVTRRCREVDGVTAISGGADGRFTLDVGGGHTATYHFDAGAGNLLCTDTRVAGFTDLVVGEYVTGFTPTFYEADGATVTTDPAAAHMIDLALTVDLPRDTAAGRTVRGRVWLRRW